MKPELYKTIKDHPDYEVSNYGNVRSWKNGSHGKRDYPKQLRSAPSKNGYFTVSLSVNGKKKTETVHQLVLKAFIGAKPKDYDACHNDGDKLNNNIDNLRWDTRKNNHADKKKHGTSQVGSNHGMSKLTESDIPKIFALRKSGLVLSEIGDIFGVVLTTIRRILNGETWSHANPTTTPTQGEECLK